MRLVTSLPRAPVLRQLVRRWLVIDSPDGHAGAILPDVGLALSVRLGGHGSHEGAPLPAAALRGLASGPLAVQHSPGTRLLVADFAPGGAAAFFPVPLHELYGAIVPLEALSRDSASLTEQAGEAADPTQVLERWLMARLLRPVDRLVRHALGDIAAAGGVVRIATLAAQHGLSLDAFEKRFRREVGATPKRHASIVRLRAIVDAGAPAELTALAHRHGYFDQAHFNNDFKKFTGQSPRAFFARGGAWGR